MSSEDLQLTIVQAEKEVEFAVSVLTDAMDDHSDLTVAIEKAKFHLDIAHRKSRSVDAELHKTRIGSRA